MKYPRLSPESTFMYCSGPNCPICRAIEKFKKVPWYKKLWNKIRGLFK